MRNAGLPIAIALTLILTGCAVHSNHAAPKASPGGWNYLQETSCAATETPSMQPAYMKEALERRGAEGWELISLVRIDGKDAASPCYLLTFKR